MRLQFFSGLAFALCVLGGHAAEPEVITEPVTVAQYDDSIVVYLHGFDLYPDLNLECRLLAMDGTVADLRTMDLGERWEKPAITMRTGATEYSGVVVSASSGGSIFFRRLYTFGKLDPQTLVTTAADAFVEPGQFLTKNPTIPLPNMAALPIATLCSSNRRFSLQLPVAARRCGHRKRHQQQLHRGRCRPRNSAQRASHG